MRVQAQHRSDECEQLCSQAEVAQESGRLDRADALLNRAIKRSSRDRDVQRQLAESLWSVGRQRESLELLAQLAVEYPHDTSMATLHAERLSELGHYEEALDRLQPAIAAERTAIDPLRLKAEIQMAQGDSDAALATWQRLRQMDGGETEAQLEMAKIYLERGQPDRAAPLLRTLLAEARATEQQRIEAQWRLGEAYVQAHRWTDAAVELADAAAHREMTADDWHRVAYTQFRGGDVASARDSLSHALGLEPYHVAAMKLAAVLQSRSEFGDRLQTARFVE
jgi:tetratricopeptide (TPR) repeat protein